MANEKQKIIFGVNERKTIFGFGIPCALRDLVATEKIRGGKA